MLSQAAQLAQNHWNETPLFISEEERYTIYPWLPAAGEFDQHRGHRVLEVGCGTGCDLLQFARNGASAVGVDITDKHLELARGRVNGQALVLKAEGAKLPFPDESFDYVYSHGVIHHSDHPRAIIDEIFRVLRKDGRFNIHLYAAHSYDLFVSRLRYPTTWRTHIENSTDPVHIDFYSPRAARSLVAPARDVKIQKFHCSLAQNFAWLLGYYVVITGKNPAK